MNSLNAFGSRFTSLPAVLVLLMLCKTINAFSSIRPTLYNSQTFLSKSSHSPAKRSNRLPHLPTQHPNPHTEQPKLLEVTCLYGGSSSSEIDPTIESTWKEISKDIFTSDKRPVILFDGVCNLCNGGVNYALDNDSVGNFRFASLQSKIGQSLLLRSGKKANDISSIVLVTETESYFKSDAVLRIAKRLDGNVFLPLMGFFGFLAPGMLRNVVYDVVADNRYRFGQSDSCRIDDEEFNDRFIPDPQ